jgi:hypothetical protein
MQLLADDLEARVTDRRRHRLDDARQRRLIRDARASRRATSRRPTDDPSDHPTGSWVTAVERYLEEHHLVRHG